MPLTGVALVAGGGSGIGQETVFAFAEAGCKAVAVADINEDNARKTAEQSKQYASNSAYQSFHIKVDVVDPDNVQDMVDTALKVLGGRIDFFVNCAGVPNMSSFPISDLRTDHFDRVVKINLYGTINCMKAVSKAMQSQEPVAFAPETRRLSRHPERLLGRGSIVNLGSVNSILANSGNMSYVTSKHAILAATKVAALDLAKDLIRVNVVLPGSTETPMFDATVERLPDFRQLLIDRTPLHRIASTDEIADTIIHICSPSASYMTGATVVIDGGLTARL